MRESNAEAVFSCKPIETNVGLSTMTVLSLYSLGEHVARVSQNDIVEVWPLQLPQIMPDEEGQGKEPRKIARFTARKIAT